MELAARLERAREAGKRVHDDEDGGDALVERGTVHVHGRPQGQREAAHAARHPRRLHALEREAHELAGQPFNLGSPKQLGEILFGKLGLPVVKKTATGQPSTDEDVLTHAMFPQVAPKFFASRAEGPKNLGKAPADGAAAAAGAAPAR